MSEISEAFIHAFGGHGQGDDRADGDSLEALLHRPLRLPDIAASSTTPKLAAPTFRLLAAWVHGECRVRGRITRRKGDGVYVADHVTGLWFPRSHVRRWDAQYVWISAWIAQRRALQFVGPSTDAPIDHDNLPRFDAYNGDGGYHG